MLSENGKTSDRLEDGPNHGEGYHLRTDNILLKWVRQLRNG